MFYSRSCEEAEVDVVRAAVPSSGCIHPTVIEEDIYMLILFLYHAKDIVLS